MSRQTFRSLAPEKALQHMRTGSVLVHMHGKSRNGYCWFVVPGGAVNDAVASKIKNHPCVIGQKDGLFPQHDQTWRFQSPEGAADHQSGS